MPANYESGGNGNANRRRNRGGKKKKGKGKPSFRQQLRGTDSQEERYDVIDAAADRRTTPSSRARFLKSRGLRDPDKVDPRRFTAPRSQIDVQRDAGAAAELEYGGLESNLQQMETNIPVWYGNYQQQLMGPGGLQQQTAAAAAPVIQGAQTRAQETQQVAPGVDPNTPAGQDAQLAALARGAIGDTVVGMLQGINQANTNFYGQMSANAGRAQVGDMVTNQRYQGDVARDRGAFTADYVAGAREGERAYGGELHRRRLENEAFGLDEYEAQTERRDKRRDDTRERVENRRERRQDRRDAKRDRQAERADTRKERADFVAKHGISPREVQDGISPAERKRMRQHKKGLDTSDGGASGESGPSGDKEVRQTIRRGVQLVRQKDNGTDHYWHEAYEKLVRNDGLDPIVARAIIQGARGGKLGPKTRRRLEREYGITGLTLTGKHRRPKPDTIDRPPSARAPGGNRPT